MVVVQRDHMVDVFQAFGGNSPLISVVVASLCINSESMFSFPYSLCCCCFYLSHFDWGENEISMYFQFVSP